MKNLLNVLLCVGMVWLGGCGKHGSPALGVDANRETSGAKFDACALITGAEIEAVQGSPIKDTKSSGNAGEGMFVSQCFYTAAESNKSVSLAVTQGDPDSSAKRSASTYWQETFGPYENEKKEKAAESDGDKEKRESLRGQNQAKGEEENKVPPTKISGVGDSAFWSGNRVGGALYVLKKDKDAFIRISLGGPDKEEIRIEKSKKLAQKAVDRF